MVHQSGEQGNAKAQEYLISMFRYNDIFKSYEKSLYWSKKYFKSSGSTHYDLPRQLKIKELHSETHNLDSLVDLHLARCYLSGKKVEEKNEYLSWYFYKKTKEKSGKKKLKALEETVFKKFVRCYNVIITLLCIGKFSKHPKEVFVMIAKELWKTKNDKEWEY
jgi:hypothetical protein